MIRLATAHAPLSAAESHALETLADLARLPWVDDREAEVVEVAVTEAGAPPLSALALAPDGAFAVEDGRVLVPRALLGAIARLAFITAEQRSSAHDRFDRVPSSENELVAAGLERQPVVSQIAAAFMRAATRAAGRRQLRTLEPWPQGQRWAAAITHDLDVVSLWPAFTAMRVAELLRAGELRQAAQVVASAAASVARAPVWKGVRHLLDLESSVGARTTWFVLSGSPTLATARRGDLTYRPESPLARRIITAVVREGHEIGLHGSFATMLDAECFADERMRLERIAGQPVSGVRQHFLRVRPGATQRAMRQAGFSYDASLGFPDRNGFRFGVADTVAFWDDAAATRLPLEQVPLVWMDRALSKYQGNQDPRAWIDDGLLLAESCRTAQGLWVGLWHPNLTEPLGYPGAAAAFERLVRTLAESGAWLTTLGDAVRWRARRRSARVATLSADGRHALTVAPDTPPTADLPRLEPAR